MRRSGLGAGARCWSPVCRCSRVRGGVHGLGMAPCREASGLRGAPADEGVGTCKIGTLCCHARRDKHACSSTRTWAVTSGRHVCPCAWLDASSLLDLSSLVQTDQHQIHGDGDDEAHALTQTGGKHQFHSKHIYRSILYGYEISKQTVSIVKKLPVILNWGLVTFWIIKCTHVFTVNNSERRF